jgi:hypothetical protein
MHLWSRSNRPLVPERESHWRRFLFCCFAGIVGFRLFLVEKFATSIAYGDDLDGIARRILRPWEDGTLSWSALFAAHNGDHRIVATRLWEIFWYELNGSWDPKLVMLVKVPIFAAAAVIFIHILAGGLEKRRFVAGAVLTVLFAFPFAFANMLWAFQSQFDFFLLLAALGWLSLLRGRVIAALLIAAAAILTLGSGPLVAASYVPFFVMGWLEKKQSLQRTALCVTAAVAILVVGLMSPTRERPPHTGTPAEKAATLFRVYAWPYSNLLSIVERLPETERYIPGKVLRFPSAERSWLLRAADQLHQHPAAVVAFNFACALLVAAPLLVVAWEVYRRRVPWSIAIGPLALSGFAFLMIAATAVARANQVTVAPRYLDHVALAGFSSLVCCFILAARNPRRRRWVAAWGGIMGIAYAATMVITLAQMSRGTSQQSLEILQRYFATTPHNHAALLEGDAFRRFVVSDDPTQFMAELDEVGLDRVLPRSVTAPGAPLGRAAAIVTPLAKAGPVVVMAAVLAGIWVVRSSRRRSEAAMAGAIPIGSSQASTGA